MRSTSPAAAADFPRFQAQEIDPHAGEICYAVTAADVNGDRKPDVVAVTEDAVVWYENPSWRKQDIIRKATARDNVCIQPHDIDGDGRVDFALGAGWRPTDTKDPSTLQWLGRDAAGPLAGPPDPVRGADAAPAALGRRERDGQEATRRRRPCRAAAPRARTGGKGRGCASSFMTFPSNPRAQPWPVEIADSSLHTIHNLQLIDMDGDRRDEIVVAAWEGVFVLDRDPAGRWTKTRIGTGNQEAKPFKGASEVKVGRLARTARPTSPRSSPGTVSRSSSTHPPECAQAFASRRPARAILWSRQVIAEPVQWGHAVWCADLDGDGDDELIIGQRDPNKPGTTAPRGPGVFVFDPKPDRARSRSTGTPSTTAAWPARTPWPPTWTATAGSTSSPAAGPPIT